MTSVDPTKFSAPPSEDLAPRVDSDVPAHMLILVTYDNGIQASPIVITSFTLCYQGFSTIVTCPVMDLADELDVVLGHEWCYEHKVVISYKDEQITFVYKDHLPFLKSDDSRVQTHAMKSYFCLIR